MNSGALEGLGVPVPPVVPVYEDFEDTKGVIRIPKSKKNRQHNDQKTKIQSMHMSSTRVFGLCSCFSFYICVFGICELCFSVTCFSFCHGLLRI
jgi:hypothetical protein